MSSFKTARAKLRRFRKSVMASAYSPKYTAELLQKAARIEQRLERTEQYYERRRSESKR